MTQSSNNYYAIIENRGTDQAHAVEVWTDSRDAGHPDVTSEAKRRVHALGGWSEYTWVYVDGEPEVGDLLDVSDDNGVAEIVRR